MREGLLLHLLLFRTPIIIDHQRMGYGDSLLMMMDLRPALVDVHIRLDLCQIGDGLLLD